MILLSNPERPPLESAQRAVVVDYSPAAIDRRMRELASLWEFWRYLRKFKTVKDRNSPRAIE
ncbi:MAG: hypothetical protein HYX68_17485 [Planctomycetes bacterium]|nr:hypothetical protein [Planctomycetota bacterium]